MRGKSYPRRTSRSKRKMRSLPEGTVSVETADGQARFPMALPMNLLLFDVAAAIEQTASQAGRLMMKALIDEEVEQVAGPRYTHQPERQATRWGQDEGHVLFAGRKVAISRPRVRSAEGREVPLQRDQAFAHPRRMEQAVRQRILRRVSTREYAGVLEEGFEETLTINRLNLSPQLRRLFASTNLIESCLSRAGDLCRDVKHGRDANMARRWAGRVLLKAKERFRRIQGHREMPRLVNALGKAVGSQEALA